MTLSFTYTVTVSGNAYNKAYVLSNRYLTSDFPLIASTASNIHHTVNNGSGSINDTKPTILNQTPTYTALYICTHGGSTGFGADGSTKPGRFFDCTYQYQDFDLTDTHRIYATDVATAIQSKSVSQPPYNFVFVDGCSTAADDTLADAFFPNVPGSDQVYLSFTTEVGDSIHNAAWSNAIWTGLSNGKTITEAIAYANNAEGKPDINTDTPDGAAQYKTIGDANMKLHGVYGFPDLGTAWHN